MDLKLAPPWVTYANEVKALFAKDKAVKVIFDNDNMELKLYVEGQKKADAIDRLIGGVKKFGNVGLNVTIIPSNLNAEAGRISDIKAAFEGNEAVRFIYDAVTPFGELHYGAFAPEVVQFYNDDMSDINGNMTTVYQEVARDVIGQDDSVFFCSDALVAALKKPLGEWP